MDQIHPELTLDALNARHAMVDIETMNVTPDAAVLTIGACIFDPRMDDTEASFRARKDGLFHAVISLESNEEAGRTFSASTIRWWLQQDKAAQQGLFDGKVTNLKNACYGLRKFFADNKATHIWAKSPDFDCVILSHAFRGVGEVWPFKFWESRCVRTAIDMAYPEGDPPKIGVGVAHDALDDAIRQALQIQDCYRVLAA